MARKKDHTRKKIIHASAVEEQEQRVVSAEEVVQEDLLAHSISTGTSMFVSSQGGLDDFDELYSLSLTREMADEDDHVSSVNDDLQLYLHEIARYPLLTFEDEQRLGLYLINARVERQKPVSEQRHFMIKQGEEAARLFVESNLRLVVSIAKRYPRTTMSLLDAIQEGNLGLMRAVEKFDARKGYRFSTYATWWVRQAVLRGLAEKDRTIRLPVHLVERFHRMHRVGEYLIQKLGRAPNEQELATAMNLSIEKVHAVLMASDPVSLQQPVGNDASEAELGDFLPDSRMSPSDEALHTIFREQIQIALKTLSAREQLVLTLRYGLGESRIQTLAEIGQHLHVTRERVRQIEIKAIRKLQQSSHWHLFQDMLD